MCFVYSNSQSSDEEVEVICRIVDELVGRQLSDKEDKESHVVNLADDILLVTPYNMQVRKLKTALPLATQTRTWTPETAATAMAAVGTMTKN